MRNPSISKSLLLIALSAAAVFSQLGYDATKITLPQSAGAGLSPAFMRLADLGFHSTVGSFSWISTMPEVLGIYFRGNTQYLSDLKFVNAIDPKLSYPYAFSVIILPVLTRLPDRDAVALAIGARGIANADPDWRIPYYMAADFYLDRKDTASALRYYDLAAHTPGIPLFAKQFSLNFGALPDDRAKTKAIWTSIRDTTNDDVVKARAQAYIDRLDIFDYLEAAARAYKMKNGKFPADLQILVDARVIPFIPPDPFGFGFKLETDGSVGINLTKNPGNN
jgi:hypothetical protein